LTKRPVGPVLVVVDDVAGQDVFQMAASEDQHPVESLATHSPYEALGERIGPWSADRGADDPDSFSLEDCVEAQGELRISVPDQELD
jgi:hypothetical protein